MTVSEMHYDFKQKLNKIDSQKSRNLRVPEIDWKLNEAIEYYVKIIAEPKVGNQTGVELSQRTTDDIRTIVVDDAPVSSTLITNTSSYLLAVPQEYMYFLSGMVIATKGSCNNVTLTLLSKQHDDRHQESGFNNSSFEWREANISFVREGIKVYTDGTFAINSGKISYIKSPRVVHNAQNAPGGSYSTLSGVVLTGSVDCDLPPHTHREIVDLAVAITAGDLGLPDYNVKVNKTKLS